MRKSPSTAIHITVRLPENLLRELKARARREDRSLSSIVRVLLGAALKLDSKGATS